MNAFLRIRDFVGSPQSATYPNVEDQNGRRDTVRCSAHRPAKHNGQDMVECITFVADNFHNRCLFLLQRNIEEVSVPTDEGFRRLRTEDFVGKVFAPCLGEALAPAAEVKGTPDEDVVIQTVEDVLKLPKAEQDKVVKSEGCPLALLKAVADCDDPALSKRAKSFALQVLKDLEEEGKPPADGTDDGGQTAGDGE